MRDNFFGAAYSAPKYTREYIFAPIAWNNYSGRYVPTENQQVRDDAKGIIIKTLAKSQGVIKK